MAKLALINKQARRKKLVDKYAKKFEAVKIKRTDSPEVCMQKMQDAAELPRNANKTRLHNRCAVTGRSRGFMSHFGLCRQQVRTLASKGELPGVRKSSW